MKKMISYILCVVLMMALTGMNVNAEDGEGIYVTYNSNGEIVLWNSEMDTTFEKISIDMTEYDSVYRTSQNELIMQTSENTFQKIEVHEIVMDSYENVTLQLQSMDLTEEEKENIMMLTQEQNALGNYNAKTVVFTEPQIVTRATTNNTYTYSGHKMKDEMVYYLNLQTATNVISSGSQAKGVAAALVNIGISIAGSISNNVAFFSGGISALQAYCNATNVTASSISTVDPNNYSRIEAYVNYNVYTKKTYEDRGEGFELGLISQRYIINKVVLNEHFIVNDTYGAKKTFTKVFGENSTGDKKSAHFANPAPYAIQWTGNHYDERLASFGVKVNTKTIYLSSN